MIIRYSEWCNWVSSEQLSKISYQIFQRGRIIFQVLLLIIRLLQRNSYSLWLYGDLWLYCDMWVATGRPFILQTIYFKSTESIWVRGKGREVKAMVFAFKELMSWHEKQTPSIHAMVPVRQCSLTQKGTHSAPATQRNRWPLLEGHRSKEVELGRLREAFARPEVCT